MQVARLVCLYVSVSLQEAYLQDIHLPVREKDPPLQKVVWLLARDPLYSLQYLFGDPLTTKFVCINAYAIAFVTNTTNLCCARLRKFSHTHRSTCHSQSCPPLRRQRRSTGRPLALLAVCCLRTEVLSP